MIAWRKLTSLSALLALLTVVPVRAIGAVTRGPVFDAANRSFLPHILVGADLGELQGQSLDSIRVYADWGKGLQQIPYQVDERNAAGQYILDDGQSVRADEQPGVLDSDDELAVLLRDAGFRVHTGSWPPGVNVGQEIQLDDPVTGRRGYLYVYSFSRAPVRSKIQHMQYDRARDVAVSSESRIAFHPKYPYVMTEVAFSDYKDGGLSVNLIDRLKVRIRGRTLGNLVEIKVTEEDVDSTLIGTRSGPVRVIREIEGISKLGPMPAVPIEITMKLYPRFVRAPVSFTMPGPIRTFLNDLDVLIGIDLRDLRGGTFSTLAFNRGTIVDGKTTRAEQNVPLGDEEWVMITGKGVTFYGQLAFEKGLPLKKEVHFIDSIDGSNPPESVPGQLPEAGFKLVNWHSLEAKSYVFEARIAAMEGFPLGGGSGVFKSLENDVRQKAGGGVGPRVVIAHETGEAAEAAKLQRVIAEREKSVAIELMSMADGKRSMEQLASSGANVVALMSNVDGMSQYLADRGIRTLRASVGGSDASIPPDRVVILMQQCLDPGAKVLFPTGSGRDRSLLPAYQKAAAAAGLELHHISLDERAEVGQALRAGLAQADAVLVLPNTFWSAGEFERFHAVLEAVKAMPRPKPVFVTGREGVAEGALLGLGFSAGSSADEIAGRVLALLKGEDGSARGGSASPAMQIYINPATLRWGRFKLPIQIIKNATHVATR